MLTFDKVQKFFEDNKIPLEAEIKWSQHEVDMLYLKAAGLAYSFASFINMCIVSPDKDGITTNFKNWDSLYEIYTHFMVGLNGAKC